MNAIQLMQETLTAFLPTGRLRAAINFGNGVLVQRDPSTGTASGIAVELARALAQQLCVPLELVYFESAGDVVAAAGEGRWDLAFLARDPLRAETIAYTPPYVVIEGSYLVKQEAPYRTLDDLDATGVRIAVGRNAAYDLYLTRHLQQAELVRAATTPGAVDLFIEQALEAAAGVRSPLLRFAAAHPEYRVVDGCFMSIEQALAVPQAAAAVRPYLTAFIEAQKDSGKVRQVLDRSGQADAQVAPLDAEVQYPIL